jgi:hypothetical protein
MSSAETGGPPRPVPGIQVMAVNVFEKRSTRFSTIIAAPDAEAVS